MKWQEQFEIDDGKRQSPAMTIVICLLVLLTTAAAWFHYDKSAVRELSDSARERIMVMKRS